MLQNAAVSASVKSSLRCSSTMVTVPPRGWSSGRAQPQPDREVAGDHQPQADDRENERDQVTHETSLRWSNRNCAANSRIRVVSRLGKYGPQLVLHQRTARSLGHAGDAQPMTSQKN